jgi:hypothetical protein
MCVTYLLYVQRDYRESHVGRTTLPFLEPGCPFLDECGVECESDRPLTDCSVWFRYEISGCSKAHDIHPSCVRYAVNACRQTTVSVTIDTVPPESGGNWYRARIVSQFAPLLSPQTCNVSIKSVA